MRRSEPPAPVTGILFRNRILTEVISLRGGRMELAEALDLRTGGFQGQGGDSFGRTGKKFLRNGGRGWREGATSPGHRGLATTNRS